MPNACKTSALLVTDRAEQARGADVYIVTVPTPVDGANRPDLTPLLGATELVGGLIAAGRQATIVYESTVYPGVTEEVCGPLIERVSGLAPRRATSSSATRRSGSILATASIPSTAS